METSGGRKGETSLIRRDRRFMNWRVGCKGRHGRWVEDPYNPGLWSRPWSLKTIPTTSGLWTLPHPTPSRTTHPATQGWDWKNHGYDPLVSNDFLF